MKKALLCAVMVALCVSAAFGGATEDLMKAVQDKTTTPQKIRNLIKLGADVNAKDKYGMTALMLAVRDNSNAEVIKILINAGADVNAKHNYGWTALMWAAHHNSNAEVIKALLNAGTDVNAKDNDGMTALMLAVENNSNLEVIKSLINAKADVNAKNAKETNDKKHDVEKIKPRPQPYNNRIV